MSSSAQETNKRLELEQSSHISGIKAKREMEIAHSQHLLKENKLKAQSDHIRSLLENKAKTQKKALDLRDEEKAMKSKSERLAVMKSNMESNKKKLTSTHKDIKHEIARMEKSHAEKDSHINKLQSNVDKNYEIIRKSEEAIMNAKSNIESSEVSIKTEKAKEEIIENQILSLNEELEIVLSKLATARASLNESASKVKHLKNDHKVLNDREKALERNISNIDRAIETSHNNMNVNSEKLIKTQNELSEAEVQLKAIKRSEGSNTPNHDLAKSKIHTLNQSVSTLHDIANAGSKLAGSRVLARSNAGIALRALIGTTSAVSTALTLAEGAFDKHSEEIKSLEVAGTKIKSEITNNRKSVTEAKGEKMKHERIISTNTKDAHALHNERVKAIASNDRMNKEMISHKDDQNVISRKIDEHIVGSHAIDRSISNINMDLDQHSRVEDSHKNDTIRLREAISGHENDEKDHDEEISKVRKILV